MGVVGRDAGLDVELGTLSEDDGRLIGVKGIRDVFFDEAIVSLAIGLTSDDRGSGCRNDPDIQLETRTTLVTGPRFYRNKHDCDYFWKLCISTLTTVV